MPKHGSRGFRWADLAMEHQKAISFYTASKGSFPDYTPCPRQTDAYLSCLDAADYAAIKCAKEKVALSECIDSSPMVSSPLQPLSPPLVSTRDTTAYILF